MLKLIGGGAEDLLAVYLHRNALTVAEVRHKTNVIKIDQLASAVFPGKLQPGNSSRQQDMIRDAGPACRHAGLPAITGCLLPGQDRRTALYAGPRRRLG